MKLSRVFALILVLSTVCYAGNIPNVAPTKANETDETTETIETTEDTQDETVAVILNLLENLLGII